MPASSVVTEMAGSAAAPARSVRTAAAGLLCAVLIVLSSLLLCACGSDPAVNCVTYDLDGLRKNSITAGETTGFRSVLDELRTETDEETFAEMEEDYIDFLSRIRDFDYEIIACEEDPEVGRGQGEDTAVAEVTIATYDFGKAYISTWADFFEKSGTSPQDGSDSAFDEAAFYSSLFANLSEVDDKDCIRTVKVKVTDIDGTGNWKSDVKTNFALHDALFGGMLSEMQALAGQQ